MPQVVDALGLVGTTVDQVRFDACVDSGGFGLVYKGKHLGLDEVVAIKTLRLASISIPTEDVRESLAARFRDETKLLYRLSQGHLDIVRCIGSGTITSPVTGELTPYMVLEWLDGKTLSADLRERREAGLPSRTIEEVIEVLDPAAGALAYAHAQGVVHRDVKPGNLFLAKTRDGGTRVKVLDFGLAKIVGGDIGVRPSVQTQAGVHFCSPSYGAPEQFTHKLGPISPATDVYSFVMVILEMMRGEKVRPAGTLAEGLVKTLDPTTGSPKPSSIGVKVAPAIDELLHRALAQNPLERPRDMGVFWAALREVVAASRGQPPVGAMTVADAGFASAMEQVRAEQRRMSPFAGTMVMAGGPQAPPVAAPRPAAGMPPPAAQVAKTRSVNPPPMSPLAASVLAPSHPPPPFAQQPHPQSPQSPQRYPQRPPAQKPHPSTAATGPGLKKRKKKSSGIVPAFAVFFAILILGSVAVFWLWKRQHGL